MVAIVSVKTRERILQHHGVSSIIQMAAVPLRLFSLLGLNTEAAKPKETDIHQTSSVLQVCDVHLTPCSLTTEDDER